MALLTKSKYMIGLQCPKYLWMMYHDLDKIPEFDVATEFIIEQGNKIGQLAKKMFPEGVDLPEDDFKGNIKQTKEFIAQKKIIFEAGIIAGQLYARADVLVPVGDEWDIIEVKGSTKVKPEHIHDVSFQKYVYEKSGLKIRKCFLLHVNNKFVKKGKIKPNKLLTQQEITSEVEEAIIGIQERIDGMMEVVNSKQSPDVTIGNGCNNGLDCISEDCYSFLPESHVFELYRGGKKSLELLEAEIFCIKDIPEGFKLNDKQQIQRKCANSEEVHINKEGIKSFLSGLKEPLYFMDFETFNLGVPLYDGTKPYQQVPFQFSVHVRDKHFEYLHDSESDPREKFLLELKKALGDNGSILVYYQSFEIGRLKELAEEFPEYKEWVESVIARIVDLIVPFQNFDYYNPAQKGSCSIKEVLPAVIGRNPYKELDINNGGLASVSYFEMIFGDVDKKKVRSDLLKYCKLDTEAMVLIVNELNQLIGEKNV
jgi:hypothetical protein